MTAMVEQASAAPLATAAEVRDQVQAHLLRAAKFSGAQAATRWSLFFFFRILTRAELAATGERIRSAANDASDGKKSWNELWLDYAQPDVQNAGLVAQKMDDDARAKAALPPDAPAPPAPDDPAQAFLDWLKVITSAEIADLRDGMETDAASSKGVETPDSAAPLAINLATLKLEALFTWLTDSHKAQRLDPHVLSFWRRLFSDEKLYADLLGWLDTGLRAFVPGDQQRPLPIVVLYELLRQCAPAMDPARIAGAPGIVRSETAPATARFLNAADGTPINIAFTYPGLAALKINETTLASFPDAFRQGMAARAQRLHDTGPSAPESWEGALGLPSVHGYFTGGFPIAGGELRPESFWKAMRDDVAAFNDPVSTHGELLRYWLQLLFRGLGLEIVHMEFGQDPYEVDDKGMAVPLAERYEHFGFRDGLSQPFVDLGLGDPLPGGGTPSRNRTWAPVAPGEIFLDLPDEDGETQLLPVSKELTLGATFLVFRKLEQDVAGFRTFLSRQRPKDRDAQTALAAQFVGRWPNGTPLVLSPDAPREVNPESEAALNDFHYAADDPRGRKCPLGAHIRRANPRDIGGRDEVRRHRILRRGISYGGPLLKDGMLGDGNRRGLLFIAANSRIDLQFEVIQADWINGGELLGQAGLGRCPLTGAHDGTGADSFLEAGAAAPVIGLPRFVVTRGGDYFFAPGIKALESISKGDHFAPETGEVPFGGFSMGDTSTPALFDPDRLRRYAGMIFGGSKAVHVRLPKAADDPQDSNDSPDRICFVGRHADVKRVLQDNSSDGALEFSVRQYLSAGRYITRGSDLIIGTDDLGPTGPTRKRLHCILNKAWRKLAEALDPDGTGGVEAIKKILQKIVQPTLETALRRTARAKRIDLVNDVASHATYTMLDRFLGTPGPDWLTELGAALPFAHQHVGELPPDWIAALKGRTPDNPGFTTMQIWSAIILADLIGNIQSQSVLHVLARQAGSEMLNHIDILLAAAQAAPTSTPRTLLDAFVTNETDPEIEALYRPAGTPAGENPGWTQLYYKDVSVILLELAGTSMATIPLTFASVMGALFKFRIDLASLLPLIGPSKIANLIYETERLNPNLGVRMRYCETTTNLPSGAIVQQGELVGALIAAANLDPTVFTDPFQFNLKRETDNYLLFNTQNSPRECWGRDRVAMTVLDACVTAAGRLRGLRRVAGAAGEPSKLVGVTIGLPARFTRCA